MLRQALGDLALRGLVASDGNTDTAHKIWRLEGPAGLDAAGHVLRISRSDMGSTARGAGALGAPHAMVLNETVLAFVRGGTGPGAPGGIGAVASWATEVEFSLGGRRKVRPDAVLQAPESGVPVLMVEVDRSTMSPARVAAKFAGYRELFRAKSRDNDPVLAGESASERMTHWWRRAYPGAARESYPPVALVLADAGAKTLNNRAAMICDLTAEFWRGRRRTEEYSMDGWLDYGDSVPIPVASLDTLTRLGPMGEVWWRCGRDGLLSLTDALDNLGDHAAYKRRQADRQAEEERKHREAMELRACVDCGAVPERKSVWTEEIRGYWTHREGGTCHPATRSAKRPGRCGRTRRRWRRPARRTPSARRAGHARGRWVGRSARSGSCGSRRSPRWRSARTARRCGRRRTSVRCGCRCPPRRSGSCSARRSWTTRGGRYGSCTRNSAPP